MPNSTSTQSSNTKAQDYIIQFKANGGQTVFLRRTQGLRNDFQNEKATIIAELKRFLTLDSGGNIPVDVTALPEAEINGQLSALNAPYQFVKIEGLYDSAQGYRCLDVYIDDFSTPTLVYSKEEISEFLFAAGRLINRVGAFVQYSEENFVFHANEARAKNIVEIMLDTTQSTEKKKARLVEIYAMIETEQKNENVRLLSTLRLHKDLVVPSGLNANDLMLCAADLFEDFDEYNFHIVTLEEHEGEKPTLETRLSLTEQQKIIDIMAVEYSDDVDEEMLAQKIFDEVVAPYRDSDRYHQDEAAYNMLFELAMNHTYRADEGEYFRINTQACGQISVMPQLNRAGDLEILLVAHHLKPAEYVRLTRLDSMALLARMPYAIQSKFSNKREALIQSMDLGEAFEIVINSEDSLPTVADAKNELYRAHKYFKQHGIDILKEVYPQDAIPKSLGGSRLKGATLMINPILNVAECQAVLGAMSRKPFKTNTLDNIARTIKRRLSSESAPLFSSRHASFFRPEPVVEADATTTIVAGAGYGAGVS